MHGTGYRFAAPAEWRVVRSGRVVRVEHGLALVSVTRYALLRSYRPALWGHVVPELDRAAAGLAAQQGGKLGESSTVTISGRRAVELRDDVIPERGAVRPQQRVARHR